MKKSLEQYREELLNRVPAILTWKVLRSNINIYMAVELPGIEYNLEFIKENQEIKMSVDAGYTETVRQYLTENIIPLTILLTVKDYE